MLLAIELHYRSIALLSAIGSLAAIADRVASAQHRKGRTRVAGLEAAAEGVDKRKHLSAGQDHGWLSGRGR
jgi:hypothetical protein